MQKFLPKFLFRRKFIRFYIIQDTVIQLSCFRFVLKIQQVYGTYQCTSLSVFGFENHSQFVIACKIINGLYQGFVICRSVIQYDGFAIFHQLPPLPVAVKLGGKMLQQGAIPDRK